MRERHHVHLSRHKDGRMWRRGRDSVWTTAAIEAWSDAPAADEPGPDRRLECRAEVRTDHRRPGLVQGGPVVLAPRCQHARLGPGEKRPRLSDRRLWIDAGGPGPRPEHR